MPDTSFSITGSQIIYGLILLIIIAVAGIAGWKWLRAFLLSLQGWMAHVEVGITQLLLLQLRGAEIATLVNTAITAKRDGIDANLDQLAHHQLAGGNIRLVVNAMLSA